MGIIHNNPITKEITKERIYGLDILRAIAILYILLGHAGFFMPLAFNIFLGCFIWTDGVTLFFVLSGFLIGRILIDTFESKKVTVKTLFRFWFRRWMRTLPAYFVVLTILAGLYDMWHNKKLMLQYSLFMQNLFQPMPKWFLESWSLSIEEWFYLLTPIIFLALTRFFKLTASKAIFLTCLSVIIFFPAFRLYKFYLLPPVQDVSGFDAFFRMRVSTRLDSLMFGVLGAYMYRYHPATWLRNRKKGAIVGLFLILLTRVLLLYSIFHPPLGAYSCVFSFSAESFAAVLLLPFFENIKKGKGLIHKSCTSISIISYSLYLLNLSFVSFWLIPRLPLTSFSGNMLYGIKFSLYLLFCIVFATLLYLLIEHPFLRLRDRLTRKNKQTASDSTLIQDVAAVMNTNTSANR